MSTEREHGSSITVTFAGHREVYHPEIKAVLHRKLTALAAKYEALTFYIGGMGAFDELCAASVRELKRQNPEQAIELVLVLPYMKQSVNENGSELRRLYDEILIPMELSGVHYKRAITERNRWMVRESDLVIAYLFRDFGGAATTVKYANTQKKNIVLLLEMDNAPRKSC